MAKFKAGDWVIRVTDEFPKPMYVGEVTDGRGTWPNACFQTAEKKTFLGCLPDNELELYIEPNLDDPAEWAKEARAVLELVMNGTLRYYSAGWDHTMARIKKVMEHGA